MFASMRAGARSCACCRACTRISTRSGSPTRPASPAMACAPAPRPALSAQGPKASFEPASWHEAFAGHRRRASRASTAAIAAIAGDLSATPNPCSALKDLMASLRLAQPGLPPGRRQARSHDRRAGYLFNTTIAGIEQADAVLLIGSNPRWEAPLVNARLRKRYLRGGFPGRPDRRGGGSDLRRRLPGRGPGDAAAIGGRAGRLRRDPAGGRAPGLILGMGALARRDGAAVLALAARARRKLRHDRRGLERLQRAAHGGGAGRRARPRLPAGCDGGRDLAGILEGAEAGEIEAVYLLGADEIDMTSSAPLRDEGAFVIYQGHHGDAGAHRADVILPGAAYTEKNGDLRQHRRAASNWRAWRPSRRARRARTGPSCARSPEVARPDLLPYDNLGELRQRLIQDKPGVRRGRPGRACATGAFGEGRHGSTRRRSPRRSATTT